MKNLEYLEFNNKVQLYSKYKDFLFTKGNYIIIVHSNDLL